MEKLIKENSGLVKEIFESLKVSEETLNNLTNIYKLKENVEEISMRVMRRTGGYTEDIVFYFDIKLKGKINSKREMISYITNNSSINRKSIQAPVFSGNPDYLLNIGDNITTNFYNPKE